MLICLDCGERFYSSFALQHHALFECAAPSTLAGSDFGSLRRGWEGAPVDPEIIARVIHEANRALQEALNDPVVSPPFDEAPDWQLVPLREGVSAALDGAGPQELHEQWCGEKFASGWTYGEAKDPVARTHPCLVPYERLPPEQRAKNDLFTAIVGALR